MGTATRADYRDGRVRRPSARPGRRVREGRWRVGGEGIVGGGQMGARIRAFDWGATPLGPIGSWPTILRTTVDTMLASRVPIVLFWGPEYLALYNDAYLPTIGAKHPDALGRPASVYWSELWDVLGPLLDGVMASGEPFGAPDYPFPIERHGFLEHTYFDISYGPVRLEDGAVGGILCIVSETTGRVLGERRMRALHELSLRTADARQPDEVARLAAAALAGSPEDLPFVALYLRDGTALRRHGGCAPPGALVGPPELDPTADGPGERAAAEVLATGLRGSAAADAFVDRAAVDCADDAVLLPVTSAKGVEGLLAAGVNPHLAPYGDFLELIAAGVSTALTNALAHEQERRRAEALADLDKAKTTFFANVSHELRTPLTLILGPLGEVLEDPTLGERHIAQLEMARRNAVRLLRLVNSVLDFTQVDTGRLRAVYRPTDLARTTAELASVFQAAADSAGLELTIDCRPLPEPVYLDPELWEKVIFNLLSNALKFTFGGGISVTVEPGDGAAVVVVADTGTGIAPEELPRIFDRFHRVADVRSRHQEGTGIGLALVRELVEIHGGRVAAASEPGRGTRFTITLPYGAGHLPSEQINPNPVTGAADRVDAAELLYWLPGAPPPDFGAPEGEPATWTGETRGARVLVADDNADLRAYLTRLMEPFWSVTAVADGAAALAAISQERPDLVVADVMMPYIDGLELVKRLRDDQATRHLPIVLLSARAGAEAAVEGLAAGADDYLAKPFSARELVGRVRAILELTESRHRHARQLRGITDAAVELNGAGSTAEVMRIAGRHVKRLVGAEAVDTAAATMADPRPVLPSRPGPRLEITLRDHDDNPLGWIAVSGKPGGFTRDDEALLERVGQLAAVRLDNVRRFEVEHRIAATLQHSLLPQSVPDLPEAELAVRYLPGSAEGDVGGDWYDVVRTGDDTVVLIIGDVMGKGVQAAAAMGQVRSSLRAYLLGDVDPGQVFERVNAAVFQHGPAPFATVLCLSVDLGTGRIRFANAGHPPALVVGLDGRTRFLADRLAPPIGAFPDVTYPTVEDRLAPGDRLLLYTDGIIESRRRTLDAGMRALAAVAGRLAAAEVHAFTDGVLDIVRYDVRRDDVALVTLGWRRG